MNFKTPLQSAINPSENTAAPSPGANHAKVSIITVVFNGKEHIEATMRSVLGQDYPDLEYIVIDGGSTDGTVHVIRHHAARLAYWSSEKDRGIYDAMNKGLAVATGDWVLFMNAGDEFYSSKTVSSVFKAPAQDATVIYGGVEIRYPDFIRVERPGKVAKLWQGMQFSHQSAFIDRRYHQAHPFNISNRIAADLEFFYGAYQAGARFSETAEVVSRVITGGVSETNRVRAILASRDAVCGSAAHPLIRLYFWGRVVSSIIKEVLKRMLPKCMVRRLILMKRR